MRWEEELIKDFNRTMTNLIKETIKNLKNQVNLYGTL